MKALVLSGGTGSRLRPITHTSAKQLVPVANKAVLFYGLESLADAGITEVGIIVGDTAAEIEEAVGDGSKFGLQITYIPQDRPLGLAHAVLIAREYLGDDDFVMYLGDNFIVGGITGLVEGFQANKPDAQILLTHVPDPAPSASPNSANPARSSAWRRSRSTPRATSLWSVSTCSRPPSTTPYAPSSRPGAASWRSPTPSSS